MKPAYKRGPYKKKEVGVNTKVEHIMNLSEVETKELLKTIQERGYYIAKTPLTEAGQTFQGDLKRWSGRKYRWGVVADTHICSRYQQMTALWDFYRICKQRQIDTVFHSGDLIDGEKIYRGQEYELFIHGADGQTEYTISHYPRMKGIKTVLISGNHDASFLETAGYNVAKMVCQTRDDMTYLGDYLAYINIDILKVCLMHGHGGVPYARSYKLQKIVEQFSTENKPHFLFLGHYHVPVIIPGYRNVESISCGTFQAQTPYMATRGLQPHIAGLIVEVQIDGKGLAKVKYEWIPFYQVKKNDF